MATYRIRNKVSEFSDDLIKPQETIAADSCLKGLQNKHNCKPTHTHTLVLVSFLVRFSSIFVVQSSFVPDEYWQALEVAHYDVFGYGYLTWEWKKGLRSYLYPSVFAIQYTILQLLNLDSPYLLTELPRMLQAFLMILTDLYTYKLTANFFNDSSAIYAFFFQLSSWFLYYTGSRTLSNSVEMVLTTIGLYFVLSSIRKCTLKFETHVGTFLALLSCIIRPTALIVWVPFGIYTIILLQRKLETLFLLLVRTILIGVVTLSIVFAIDLHFYKRAIIPGLNFIQFNVLQNLSGFYGSHSWHWYFSQGLPVTLGPAIIAVIVHFWKFGISHFLSVVILASVTLLSLISHKEFRFLLPILPLCFCLAGHGVASTKSDKPDGKQPWKLFLVVQLLINVFIAVYTGLIHQRAPIDTIQFLSAKAVEDSRSSFLFLMPCHSTPYYSHIHRNVTMRFLECHPSSDPDYKEEADIFYSDPMSWLNKEYTQGTKGMPTAIALFDSLLTVVKPFLVKYHFEEVLRKVYSDLFGHLHFVYTPFCNHVEVFRITTL